MDNLCHSLVGAALAEAGLKKWTAFDWVGRLMLEVPAGASSARIKP
jgi:hypothetical protein